MFYKGSSGRINEKNHHRHKSLYNIYQSIRQQFVNPPKMFLSAKVLLLLCDYAHKLKGMEALGNSLTAELEKLRAF